MTLLDVFPWPQVVATVLVVGLCVGSFLNVVIGRVPGGESVVRPRSRCPQCGHALSWYENIPLLSWLFLRGRCRSCKTPISVRYFVVELLTGMLFLACLRRFGVSWELLSGVALVSFLIPLTFIDLEHWLLPHSITRLGIVSGLGLSLLGGTQGFIASAIGAVVGFLAFWALELVGRWVFKKEALGGGDKYLLALIGAFLTYRSLLGVIFLSSVQGAVVGIVSLLLRGKAGPELKPAADEEEEDFVPSATHLPYGPFLALAAL